MQSPAVEGAVQLDFSSEERDLAACDIYIVTVPTAVDETNRPDMTPCSGPASEGRHVDVLLKAPNLQELAIHRVAAQQEVPL